MFAQQLSERESQRVEYFLDIARRVSQLATCPRRKVGCVLVDRHQHIMATGYNGVPSGIQHCTDDPCPGAKFPSGQGLEHCLAIHAEQNALLQCSDVTRIDTVYCTTQPCLTCTKLLLNTSAHRVIFSEPHGDPRGADLWFSKHSDPDTFLLWDLVK